MQGAQVVAVRWIWGRLRFEPEQIPALMYGSDGFYSGGK